jgi:hypothetical protein
MPAMRRNKHTVISDMKVDSDTFDVVFDMHLPLAILTIILFAQRDSTPGQYQVIHDFQSEWRVYANDQFRPFDEQNERISTVYFLLDAGKYPGTYLAITSPEPYALFINGKLMQRATTPMRMSIDSLALTHNTQSLQVAVHQHTIVAGGIQTVIQSTVSIPVAFDEPHALRYAYFRDYAIVGMLVLVIMLIVIAKLNPKLAADYFSVTRIFSMREGDDSQAYSRIASSTNILFYAYCSLMLGYFLMIVLHFLPAQYSVALFFQASNFWLAIVGWLEISLIVLGIFFLKIVLVYVMSYIFGMREIGGIHFFNWVRLLLGVFGLLTVVVFLYFAVHGHSETFYSFFLGAMAWTLAGWTILIILKLQRQLSHSMFHLFSYICATELIPFLITIKVLYY